MGTVIAGRIGLAAVCLLCCSGAAGAGAPERGDRCPALDGGSVPAQAPNGAPASRERAAQHLRDVARLDIAIGRVEDGCRMLAVVATTFADTESGRRAIEDLAEDNRKSGSDEAVGGGRSAGVSGWRDVVVRATGAQDELREAVGDRVFFAEGSAEIGTRAADALNAQAGWLAHNPGLDVVVEGHADDGLSEAAAQALAVARAEAVRRVFVGRGLAPERISVLALGSAEPISACADPSCAAQNRRVVTRLVPAVVGSGR